MGSNTVARPLERNVGRTLGAKGFARARVRPREEEEEEHFNMMGGLGGGEAQLAGRVVVVVVTVRLLQIF